MRIRKHAAKLLLGSACLPRHSPPRPPTPPPPPAADRSAAADDGPFFCQLNCSPWDVMDYSNFFYFQQEGGEKGMEDILGISDASTSSVVVAGDENDSNKKKVKKRRRRKKKEEENDDGEDDEDDKEKTSSVVTIIAKSVGVGLGVDKVPRICKKNDGKGWHCNRPANPHHTLCDHHLTQLKSYGSTRYNSSSIKNIAREEAVDNRDPVKNQKKDDVSWVKTSRRPKSKAAAAAAAGSKSAGDCYYYYSGFGLQRGKSRSDGSREEEEDARAKELESESGDGGSDAPIAADGLDDNETVEDDDNVKIVGNVDNNKGRIRRNKRARKPIKARSLKSLM